MIRYAKWDASIPTTEFKSIAWSPRYGDGTHTRTEAGESPDVRATDGKWYPTASGDGDELVTNGTFDTGTTGWVATTAILSVVNTEMRITNDGTNYGKGSLTLSGLTIGDTYSFNVDYTGGNIATGVYVNIGTTLHSGDLYATAGSVTSDVSSDFMAETATVYISIGNSGNIAGEYSSIDNVTLFKKNITPSATPYTNQPTYLEDENGKLLEIEVDDNTSLPVELRGVIPSPRIVESAGHFDSLTGNEATIKDLVVTDGFDLGRSWVDVNAERSIGIVYRNNTSKPIEVVMRVIVTNGGAFNPYVDGVQLAGTYNVSGGELKLPISFTVPAGSTYELRQAVATVTADNWTELRGDN